jgi:predicted acyl esterase
MTWQAAVQAVVKANPGIDQNPRALARAVDHFMPIMNQQSLQQWREMQLQLRGAALDVREETARMYEQGRRERAREGIESREGIASRAEEGREKRSERSETGRQERFTTREQRLQSKADFDREFRTKSLALAEQRFAQTRNKQERDAAYREEKQKLDEMHRVLREHISATGAGDSKALKDLDTSYKSAVRALENSFMGKPANKDMKTGPGTLEAYPVPPDRANDPDGTTYNNGQYKKQGNQIVPVQ